MPTRYTIVSSKEAIEKAFLAHFDLKVNYEPMYNAGPGQHLPVITDEAKDLIQLLRFGYIPAKAKSPLEFYINAKSDGIIHSNTFQTAIRERRCLIPANCFFEWRKNDKQPFLIHCTDQRLFAFAGVWRTWQNPDTKEEIKTFAIITQPSNSLMLQLNVPLMPLILEKRDWNSWIKKTLSLNKVTAIMRKAYQASRMNAYPVAMLVNKPENNTREVLLPTGDSIYKIKKEDS